MYLRRHFVEGDAGSALVRDPYYNSIFLHNCYFMTVNIWQFIWQFLRVKKVAWVPVLLLCYFRKKQSNKQSNKLKRCKIKGFRAFFSVLLLCYSVFYKVTWKKLKKYIKKWIYIESFFKKQSNKVTKYLFVPVNPVNTRLRGFVTLLLCYFAPE